MTELIVMLDGIEVARLRRTSGAKSYVLTYDEAWRNDRSAYPVSLALPLAAANHAGPALEYFLRGLLPDSERRLNALAFRFGVGADDSFGLLSYIGEDCVGAVQLVRPERAELVAGAGPEQIDWLRDDEMAPLIRALRAENSGDQAATMSGQFSLPGALAKVALRRDDAHDRWGWPTGRAASTHILKPPLNGVPFHNENEHLCLRLCRAVGIEAAKSAVVRFDDEVALVVERYDRVVAPDGRVRRIHQEDITQALGLNPRIRYASEGAPGIPQIVGLLRDYSVQVDADIARLIQVVAMNWILAGTDAHARNYSVLVQSGGRIMLAPAYDVSSALLLNGRVKAEDRMLAMAIGGECRLGNIGRGAWRTQAHAVRLDPQRVLDLVQATASMISGALPGLIATAVQTEGIDRAFASRFARKVEHRVRHCAGELVP